MDTPTALSYRTQVILHIQRHGVDTQALWTWILHRNDSSRGVLLHCLLGHMALSAPEYHTQGGYPAVDLAGAQAIAAHQVQRSVESIAKMWSEYLEDLEYHREVAAHADRVYIPEPEVHLASE